MSIDFNSSARSVNLGHRLSHDSSSKSSSSQSSVASQQLAPNLLQNINNRQQTVKNFKYTEDSILSTIKVKINQKRRELGDISLVQHLKCTSLHPDDPRAAINAMRFSNDGQYLAVGGEDGILRVWKYSKSVLSFYRTYRGHSGPITEVSWSRNGFLISASQDKTVMCWHVTFDACLCAFKHPQAVISVSFHPFDDRFFLSGCLDSRLRLWSIADKKVYLWNELSQKSAISIVSFNKDGLNVIVGTATGDLVFFDADTLKYSTQISITGNSKKMCKVTGIEPLSDKLMREDLIMVSATDSKIRLYNLIDKSLLRKYTGPNIIAPMKAMMSPDGKHILCGSEDKHVYLFNTAESKASHKTLIQRQNDASRSSSWEKYQVTEQQVTCALFAPMSFVKTTDFTALESPDMLMELEGIVMVTADSAGQLRVFENKCTKDSVREEDPHPKNILNALSKSNQLLKSVSRMNLSPEESTVQSTKLRTRLIEMSSPQFMHSKSKSAEYLITDKPLRRHGITINSRQSEYTRDTEVQMITEDPTTPDASPRLKDKRRSLSASAVKTDFPSNTSLISDSSLDLRTSYNSVKPKIRFREEAVHFGLRYDELIKRKNAKKRTTSNLSDTGPSSAHTGETSQDITLTDL